MNVRALAARRVNAVLENGRSLGALANEPVLSPADNGLLQELSAGTLRWFYYLNGCLKPLLSKPLKPKDQDVFALMLVGAYQLLCTDLPDYAALSSTVDGCQDMKKEWAKKLVNGVLRQLQRQKADLVAGLTPYEEQAHPKWLFQRILDAWPEQALNLFAANNQRPQLCLRLNIERCRREAYLPSLDPELAAAATPISPWGIRLGRSVNPVTLPGFAEGLISAQDEAGQLCTLLLDPQAGDRVLDACAAPGGKTCHLLEYQGAVDELIALDNDGQRLQRVTENLDRLHLNQPDCNVRLETADAGDLGQWWDGRPFQRILLDAPCSGTGVIRRHPDIKILRKPGDIDKLVQLQQRLLHNLWQSLASGGVLLYSTCSVLPEENARQIETFLATQGDAELRPIPGEWGIDTGFGRQLLPSNQGPDGFFYALLGKKSG